MNEFITMFKLGKDGSKVRQVTCHNELKEDLESIGFYDCAYKLAEAETKKMNLDKVEDAVIVEEKPKKNPSKKATKKPANKVKKDAK